jgi:hypothetical protein
MILHGPDLFSLGGGGLYNVLRHFVCPFLLFAFIPSPNTYRVVRRYRHGGNLHRLPFSGNLTRAFKSSADRASPLFYYFPGEHPIPYGYAFYGSRADFLKNLVAVGVFVKPDNGTASPVIPNPCPLDTPYRNI